ncbi:MAG: hypothetical protein ACK4GW_06520 [Pseudorhodobacter sp.]
MRLLLPLLMLAAPAGAETLSDLRSRIAGTEISISGHIGTGLEIMDKEAISFRDADKTVYDVVFDAGREARRALEGCRFDLFQGGTPCAVTGRAEVQWNGARMRLILFEVDSLAAPGPIR